VAAVWAREGREEPARFAGDSMRPTIEPGCEVVVAWGRMPAEGEVGVFVAGERLLVHRVIARRGRWLLTRGDAAALPDLPLPAESVLGAALRLRVGSEPRPVPDAPSSIGRRLAAAAATLALRAGEGSARVLLVVLWTLRRWLLVRPRRLLGRG
jgi:hypothetical protein